MIGPVARDIARDEHFAGYRTSIRVDIVVARQVLELYRRDEVADLLVHFPDNALEESFIAFAMATEQPDLAGETDAGDVLALLKEDAVLPVDQDG